MIRIALAAAALWSGLLMAAARAQQPGSLASPGDYSFAPASAGPPTGEASLSYGSRSTKAASIQMGSGLLGDAGLRGFASLSAASAEAAPVGPSEARARASAEAGEIGLQKSFGDGTVISLAGGWGRTSVPAGHYWAGGPEP